MAKTLSDNEIMREPGICGEALRRFKKGGERKNAVLAKELETTRLLKE